MNVVAISNYPNDFNENKIRPELLKRGVKEVTFYTSQSFKSLNGESKKVEAVLCFYDLMSHNAYDAAKNISKKANVKFHLLTRKVSTWPEEIFAKEPVEMPKNNVTNAPVTILNVQSEKKKGNISNVRSVDKNDLDKLVKDFDNYVASGMSREDIMKAMSKYWKTRPLNNFGQLTKYVKRVRKTENDNVETLDIKVATKVDDILELKELIKLYESETAELKSKIKSQEAKIIDLEHNLIVLKSDKSEHTPGQRIEVVRAIFKLMENNIMNLNEGLDRILPIL
jgi:hypothetical protein